MKHSLRKNKDHFDYKKLKKLNKKAEEINMKIVIFSILLGCVAIAILFDKGFKKLYKKTSVKNKLTSVKQTKINKPDTTFKTPKSFFIDHLTNYK